MRLIRVIADYLGLTCSFRRSSVLGPAGTGDDRLLALVRLAGADTYVSEKGGQKYQDPEKVAREGVLLEVREYRPIAYAQGGGPFLPGLSILDALFHRGREAVQLLDYPASQT